MKSEMQILNKKARLNYQILETFEAGVALLGSEVKSIKDGQVSLEGAHIQVGIGSGTLEARLVGMHTAPYLPSGKIEIDPTRTRKLLLRKNEILRLWQETQAKRMTAIPLRLYTKRGLIKVEVGLAKGKKKWEKREALKKKDLRREEQRRLKG